MATCCHDSHSLAFFLSLFAFRIPTVFSLCFRSCPFPLHVFVTSSTPPPTLTCPASSSTTYSSSLHSHAARLSAETSCQCCLQRFLDVYLLVTDLFLFLDSVSAWSVWSLHLLVGSPHISWISSFVCSLPVCLPQSNSSVSRTSPWPQFSLC